MPRPESGPGAGCLIRLVLGRIVCRLEGGRAPTRLPAKSGPGGAGVADIHRSQPLSIKRRNRITGNGRCVVQMNGSQLSLRHFLRRRFLGEALREATVF
jgi:hypothetical protein